MNILVIGSGGREHAAIKAFSESNSTNKIFCSPGNAGIAKLAALLDLDIKNHLSVIQSCKENNISFVFIGPEDPLVDGLADSLRDECILAFGPSKMAAQLEGSKIFAKDFMNEADIPTARSQVVTSVDETLQAAKNYTLPYVLKADGLAAGKGVFICANLMELKAAAENIFDKKIFGKAGSRALLEQNLPGKEISFLLLTDGSAYQPLPLAQDHKRLLDGNAGPNTGGMGTVAPMHIDSALYAKIIAKIVEPSVALLQKRKYFFRGVLFIGLMIVENEPYVLEYNVRFGDPETQVLLPLLNNDIAGLFFNLSNGQLDKVLFNNKVAFCIVNASSTYPAGGAPATPIRLPQENSGNYILHAGTSLNAQNELISSGGRVLNILAVADDLKSARANAYKLNSEISFPNRQFRTDLGAYFNDDLV